MSFIFAYFENNVPARQDIYARLAYLLDIDGAVLCVTLLFRVTCVFLAGAVKEEAKFGTVSYLDEKRKDAIDIALRANKMTLEEIRTVCLCCCLPSVLFVPRSLPVADY